MHRGALTVYIVDDDAAVRDSLALMLGLAGYRTALFADAEAFLAAYRPDFAGCAIVDLRLPGASGLELQADLRARGSTLPFVIISAHGDVPSARKAFQAEAVDFLEKPFDDAQLRAAIDSAFAFEERRIERALTRR
ncbi:MAG: response regulator transcription factor, partial [Burkholderiales bacterium]